MEQLSNFYANLSLKKKLIALFVGFIIVPAIVIVAYLVFPSSAAIRDLAVKSAIRSNEQIIKNLDTFLGVLSKLSEYPITDKTINAIMRKHQSGAPLSALEKSRDFSAVNTFVFTKIKSFSPLVDSVILFDHVNNSIYGRTPAEYLDAAFVENYLREEEWLNSALAKNGNLTITGVRNDTIMSPRENKVVSVARSIIDPNSRESLGVVLINVGVRSLERLWMDITITDNSRFYLSDAENNIIFSSKREEIGQNIHDILDTYLDLGVPYHGSAYINGTYSYLISSVSTLSSWRAITIIPTNELFSYINVMLRIAAIALTIGIVLSVAIAVFIATGITKPLNDLNRKMLLVGKGNLDIEFDEVKGEVGLIAGTVNKMLKDIRQLIDRIYVAEKEKRNAEMLALQSQINPHFIYNTLNSIKWLAKMQGVPSIESSISALSSMLAFTAKSTDDFICISEEVKFIEDYLNILKLRFYNLFSVNYDIEPEVYNFKTLKFLLQPIIENAILHGFEDLKVKGQLDIRIYRTFGKIAFEVQDNGKGMDEAILKSVFASKEVGSRDKFNSIGLDNIKKRLVLHFAEQCSFSVESLPGFGTTVKVTIPEIKA